MDKETLSNYGWIVIAVLVLVVMIALATPFGSFVSEAVQSTTKGLFDVNKTALDSAGVPGLTVQDQEFDVPDMNHGFEENNGGAGESNLINFSLDGIALQAEKGMTWEQWVNSEYNTFTHSGSWASFGSGTWSVDISQYGTLSVHFTANSGSIIGFDIDLSVCSQDGGSCDGPTKDDVIIENNAYILCKW